MKATRFLAAILVISALVLGACRPRGADQQVQPIKFQYVFSQPAPGTQNRAGIPSPRLLEQEIAGSPCLFSF